MSVCFRFIIYRTAASYNSWYNASDTAKNNERAKKAYDAVLTVTTRAPTGDQYRDFSDEVRLHTFLHVDISLKIVTACVVSG